MPEVKPDKQTVATLANGALVAFGLAAWVIFLGGTAAFQKEFSGESQTLTITGLPWACFVLFPFILILSAACNVIGALKAFRMPVAILAGVVLSFFAIILDNLVPLDRGTESGTTGLSALRAMEAGGVLCCLALVGVIILSAMDKHVPAAPAPKMPQHVYTTNNAAQHATPQVYAPPTFAEGAPDAHVAVDTRV